MIKKEMQKGLPHLKCSSSLIMLIIVVTVLFYRYASANNEILS